jgi:hypothetical protein
MERKRTGGKPVMLAVLLLVYEVWAWTLSNNNGNNADTTLLVKNVDCNTRICVVQVVVNSEDVEGLVAL